MVSVFLNGLDLNLRSLIGVSYQCHCAIYEYLYDAMCSCGHFVGMCACMCTCECVCVCACVCLCFLWTSQDVIFCLFVCLFVFCLFFTLDGIFLGVMHGVHAKTRKNH